MRTGAAAAAKAGHDLVIDVTSWRATLEVGDDPGQVGLKLDADAGSLRVLEGTGGVQEQPIEFRSTKVEASDGSRLRVRGTLKMAGSSHPVEFELGIGSEQITGGATLKQTDWGIKPYSGLFGALKVADEVEVVVEASPP